MKKLIALVLALAMVATLGLAFAADPKPYSITVTNTSSNVSISEKTYYAYKVFDMTYAGSNQDDPHTYTITSGDWAWPHLKGIEEVDQGGNKTGAWVNSTYGLTFTPTANDPALYVITSTMTGEQARAMADYLNDKLPQSADGSATVEAGEQTATIGLDEAGYYVVYGTASSIDETDATKEVTAALALTSTDPTATVNPKVEVPPLNKKILGDHKLDDKGQAAIAEVGTDVRFQLDSKVPDLTGYTDYTYIVSDTMTSGLTFNGDIVVNINGTNLDSEKYEVKTTGIGDKTFTLKIPFSTLKTYAKGKPITITYSAKVNDNAITTDQENNTAYLTYSNNPYDDTTKDTTEKKVYVIDVNIDINKYTGADKSAAAGKLADAEFKLYKISGASQLFYKKGTNDVDWVAKDSSDTFKTNSAGKFTTQIQGLEVGTYYLLETKAPAGYNQLAEPIEIVISATHAEDATTATVSATNCNMADSCTVDLTDTTAGQPLVYPDVQNNKGTELPSTGGIGTTIFYIVGGLLVIGAAVILVARRKAHE